MYKKGITALILAAATFVSWTAQAANNYSCNNAKPLGEDTMMKVVVGSAFRNGVSYREYAYGYLDGNGEKVPFNENEVIGVRLSGQGISGGLCFDSVNRGKQEFGVRGWGGMNCGNLKPLGAWVNAVGTYPKAILAKNADDEYGIRYTGKGIGGGLCFKDVQTAFHWLGWAKGGKVKDNFSGFTGPGAQIKGRNGYHAIGGGDVSGNISVAW